MSYSSLLTCSDLTDGLKRHWPIYTLAGGVACLCVAHHVVRHVRREKVQSKIKERGQRAALGIQELRKQLNTENIDKSIAALSFADLQANLQGGTLKAVDVWKSYMVKALEVHERTNAVTDVIPSSKSEAMALDNKDASERGLLHGIPISVKECVGIKGMDCTAGFAALIDKVRTEDSILIQVLKSHGAVPFVKTNLPQSIYSVSPENPIFGLTCNPVDVKRSPGGSTGGEGAIIGGGGSILGIGSDIGGSVRIPGSFSGIFTLKPTRGRYSYRGSYLLDQPLDGENIVGVVEGPMGRDVDALAQFMRAALSPKMFELDPTIPPVPFREEIFKNKRPLRIGFYTYDGYNHCVPAIIRAVNVAKETLEALGHTVVPYEPYKTHEGLREWFWSTILGDDCTSFKTLMEGDDTYAPIVDAVKFNQLPYFMRWIKAKFTQLTTNDPSAVDLMSRKSIRTLRDWWQMNIGSNNYRADYINDWKSHGLDLLLCPITPCPAMTERTDASIVAYVTYTCIYNLVNLPAGTVPVTRVTSEDVTRTNDLNYYKPETTFEKIIAKDSVNSENLPAGVQIVGLPFQEEMVLGVMSQLENALKGNQ